MCGYSACRSRVYPPAGTTLSGFDVLLFLELGVDFVHHFYCNARRFDNEAARTGTAESSEET